MWQWERERDVSCGEGNDDYYFFPGHEMRFQMMIKDTKSKEREREVPGNISVSDVRSRFQRFLRTKIAESLSLGNTYLIIRERGTWKENVQKQNKKLQ